MPDGRRPNPNIPLLELYARQGFVFLTSPQIAKALGCFRSSVFYAFKTCTLDAFCFNGRYRATIDAVTRYAGGSDFQLFRAACLRIMSRVELSGVYALANGDAIAEAIQSVKARRYPLAIGIDALLRKTKTFSYDLMPTGKTALADFYDIPSLNLPQSISVRDLAGLLQLKIRDLGEHFKKLPPETILNYPDVYDYLVEHEIPNMSIPPGEQIKDPKFDP